MDEPTRATTEEPRATRLTIHDSFADFAREEWNALEHGDFVFADHRFLQALQEADCLGERTGWHPRILALRSGERLVAALPLYSKTNSYGEFIFDWAWANAAEQIGFPYYPKLVAAAPFTPATGPKFLVHPSFDRARAIVDLLKGARELSKSEEASSLHFLFSTEDESGVLSKNGFMTRHSYQYHWRNRGSWRTFDDYLSHLRSKRRSEIRRERTEAANLPLKYAIHHGTSVKPEHAEWAYGFYLSTIRKRGGYPYLTRRFFDLVFERMSEHVVFAVAHSPSGGAPVAGALNLVQGSTLYGRYWGTHEDHRSLHFELCYYQGIEWALANGVTLFEAGAQGEHKFNRGFTPSLCYSAHEIGHRGLSEAVEDFLAREREAIGELLVDYREHDPFKRTEGSES